MRNGFGEIRVLQHTARCSNGLLVVKTIVLARLWRSLTTWKSVLVVAVTAVERALTSATRIRWTVPGDSPAISATRPLGPPAFSRISISNRLIASCPSAQSTEEGPSTEPPP